jgi:PAS domain S-box-containing protein
VALYLAELVCIAVLYAVVARLSLHFATVNPSATPVWPPTGLAIGFMVLRGHRVAPAIFAGSLAANLAASGAASGLIAAGDTLEALTAAWLLKLWADGANAFRTFEGIAKYAAIAAVASAPIGATVGVLSLCAAGHAPWRQFPSIWTTWWLGDLAGALVLGPVVVLPAHPRRRPSPAQLGEGFAVLLAASLIGVLAYSPWSVPSNIRDILAFLAVAPLMWSAHRGRLTQTALAALVLSAFAIWGVTAGRGPFIQSTLNDSFLLAAVFVIAVSLPSLALAAAAAERNRALTQSEQTHRLLVESARDYAIVMLDPQGRVASWTPAAAEMHGYAAADIIGRPFGVFRLEAERTSGAPELALSEAVAAGVHRSTGWRVRADGSRFWASAVINPVRDEDGALMGFAKVVRDLSVVHEAQVALDRANAQVLQSKKLEAIGQFAGGVAHDFNNLLMIIQSQVDRLRSRTRDGQPDDALDAIGAAADRGVRLTRQLLSFSRRQDLIPERVDLGPCITEVQTLLAGAMPHGVEIKLDAAEDAWPVLADRGELELGLINLVMNARDAMPGGGEIRISVRNVVLDGREDGIPLVGEFVAIALADCGVGMAPEVLARAFDPFFTTKTAEKGTGLGLAQVQSFAHQAGGWVTARSQQGSGTTVSMFLPRMVEPATASSCDG